MEPNMIRLFRRKSKVKTNPQPDYWDRRLRAMTPERRAKVLANLVVMR
jgi:hypothetical protein